MTVDAVVTLLPPSAQASIDELGPNSSECAAIRHRAGVAREVAFLQAAPAGAMLILYQRGAFAPSSRLMIESGWRGAPSDPYAFALPVAPPKIDRLLAFADEINTVHRAEFEAATRRLRVRVRVFLQRLPGLSFQISVLEGTDPASAFGRMAASSHPFDRWHVQQIADLGGLDLTRPLPPPNRVLWDWAPAAMPAHPTHTS